MRLCDVGGSTKHNLLEPYPAELMIARPASALVNSVRNDGPELLEPNHAAAA